MSGLQEPSALNERRERITAEVTKSPIAIDGATLERADRLMHEYPDIVGLVNCTAYATPVNPNTVAADSVASRLLPDMLPTQLVEVNRTVAAVLTFDDVVNGNYKTFTTEQKTDVLSPESFAILHQLTAEFAPQGVRRKAVRTHLAINDNGKRDDWMRAAAEITGHFISDHDKVLKVILTHRPEMSPSFMALPVEGRQRILDCLEAGVNFGQLLQGESSVDSLKGVTALLRDPELFQHAVMEWLYDVAGARGYESQRGSLVVTESFFANAQVLIEAFYSLDTAIPAERIPTEIYRTYLQKRSDVLGLPFASSEDVAIGRINCMAGITTPKDAEEVAKAVRHSLGSSSLAILAKKLGSLEPGNPIAYYAPKLIKNLISILRQRNDPEALHNGIVIGAGTLAQILSVYARQTVMDGQQIESIMVSRLAHLSGTTPEALVQSRVELVDDGNGIMAGMRREHEVDLSRLERMDNLGELPGKTFVAIGIGGGSDVATAEVMARTIEAQGQDGKICLGDISIRTTIDSEGRQRELLNYVEDLGDGVYVAGPGSRMSAGRYHEDLVAATGRCTVAIMRDGSISLDHQLDKALHYLGSTQPLDTIIGVDTGGDALTPTSLASPSSPSLSENQDHEVLAALSRVGPSLAPNILVGIAGLGVDSPQNAGAMLEEARSRYYLPTQSIGQDIINRYKRLGLPSDNPKRFAKTLPAFVKALQGERGLVEVALPPEVLLSPTNPWNPFTYVDEISTAFFFIPLDDHLSVIDR